MSLRTRKAMALVATSALMLGAAACSSERTTDSGDGGDTAATDGGGEAGGLIGIAMPTRSLERWNNDGANLEAALQEMGYETSLQYADNEVDQQINQIQTMLNQDPEVLVIAAIDGTALTPVLEAAENQDVDVIAYDRLINDSGAVDYYATFDNYGVGQMQGEFIVEQLGLEDGEEGPFTLEPFAGSPDDNNARFFFAGAWDVLLPYVESGQLVVPSGKAPASVEEWTTIGIQGWESDTAQSEMENRLNSFYAGGEKVDVVLSPNDSLALGIEQALDAAGYTPGEDWPIITGQDADLANVNNMLAGMQSMTVWKDTRTLGSQVATMVDQIVKGEEVEVNDTETYDNGVKVVPSYLLPPEVVTPETVEDKLVGSEFYDASELDL
ncbi:monosaccharide ABC transporter substrate-binding protein, CUT2 family [Georgenia satyanarayanai]|uniref:Monosaccharide ABC transporter substrate-binding protein, CUT2 family n=1 Tax=Georgenia satyanarayanai TaxID=860221 RepID=A0A2Y9AF34_9MICO|nr:multiple monosaccharide ABC transporter substrate-binding protein [Georgenia satyanarayanai]PYF99319.1 monosaccharide ABC transporter substrate-binding protein (CUT2 family) [Georgenia satyanarayanai]SSA43131.1 monosaccharide ABC transporter substrate-binding protein, CUT2 family [Georgenia satyanarayanai]